MQRIEKLIISCVVLACVLSPKHDVCASGTHFVSENGMITETVGVRALKHEREYGLCKDEDAMLQYKLIMERAIEEIPKIASWSKKDAIKVLKSLGNLLASMGYQYDDAAINASFGQSLVSKNLDCDTYALIYASIGEMLRMPIFIGELPEHVVVIISTEGLELLWETTVNESRSEKYYRDNYSVKSAWIEDGLFLRSMDGDRIESFLLCRIANMQAEKEKYTAAISIYNDALELHPASCAALNNRGFAYRMLGMPEKARADYARGLSIYKNLYLLLYSMAELCMYTGRHKEAMQYYDKTLREHPKHSKSWHQLGVLKYNAGYYVESIKCYENAIKCDSSQSLSHFNLGNLHITVTGDYNQARKCFVNAIKCNPSDPESYVGLAQAKYNLGDSSFCEDLNKAIRLGAKHANDIRDKLCK